MTYNERIRRKVEQAGVALPLRQNLSPQEKTTLRRIFSEHPVIDLTWWAEILETSFSQVHGIRYYPITND